LCYTDERTCPVKKNREKENIMWKELV